MNIVVREETPADGGAIRRLVADAFAGAEHSAPPVESDGVPGEATLVGWLRESDAYDAALSLIASDGGEIVGFAMATWGDLDGVPVLGIGPVAVAPATQNRGIGTALMHELLSRAADRGERVVVLLGDPGYYERFGFVPASSVGIAAPDPSWGTYFQACPLDGVGREVSDARAWRSMGEGVVASYTGPRGTYTYAEPFRRLG